MSDFNKIVIFGVGLIGGSFALALKTARAASEIVGFERSPQLLEEALRLGVIDRAATDMREVAGADLVLIAAPVGQMPEIFASIAPYLSEKTVVTDGGSTKGDVVAAARAALGGKIARFVPAHPIAGAEHSGVTAARSDLFQGRKVVITPLPENDMEARTRVEQAWQQCGATIHVLEAGQHDRVFAAVSHLPHLLAFALVRDLACRAEAGIFFDFAASGFRDFTRIAASHPEMWRDICLANRDALLEEIDTYQKQVEEFKIALQNNDGAALEERFAVARSARRAWGERLQAQDADMPKK
ncbi:MAG: prephenate dehydrogenase/arogenate dehydrogenase family protein [Zoogloeaceae bacterium]|jgi:prephenate dehydrogenase|nr:prephenate dehydrogenase/arogenate dehydrogenase family protein [Zoogloeaceae bacterium]